MREELSNVIESEFGLKPNKNQLREFERLIFEITRREGIGSTSILKALKKTLPLHKYSGRNKFFCLKNALIKRRFPLILSYQEIDTKKVFLNKIREPLGNNWQVATPFKPLEIYIESEVKSSFLAKNFQKKFPETPVKIINHYSQYLRSNKFSLAQLKKPLIFIVKENWDFIKPCPCTKYHLSCGYWILNLGFGCPFDCSYCFLQQYTNSPGIVLPANLDDFFKKFDQFAKTLNKPIRIGTGEFCDSLALDDITEYSKKLIPYFSQKKVLFELKTKSTNIANLLEIEPSGNTIISWSLNPSTVIETEEIGAADLKSRFEAARSLRKAGYKLGFHFDPIIHLQNWEALYKDLIGQLYSNLKAPFSWISLGTLRCQRKLKTMAELRFPQSNVFYGELLLGEDKKLRYPHPLRKDIYKKMLAWIREYDKSTPVYLCMEGKDSWKLLGDFNSTGQIENQLLKL